jgi:hypothetical protein
MPRTAMALKTKLLALLEINLEFSTVPYAKRSCWPLFFHVRSYTSCYSRLDSLASRSEVLLICHLLYLFRGQTSSGH